MQTILSENNSASNVYVEEDKKRLTPTQVIEFLYVSLLFLLPFFFLPITNDFLVLNKTFLTVFIAGLSLALFFFQAFRKGSLTIRGFKVYLPFVLLLVAALASTYFSTDRYTSVFGSFYNFNNSILFWIALIVIGFVASNVRIRTSKLLTALMAGTIVTTLVALFTLYGGKLPFLSRTVSSSNLVGTSTNAIALFILVSLLAFNEYLKTDNHKFSKVISLIAFVLTSIYVFSTMNVLAIVVLVAGLLYLGVTNYDSISRNVVKAAIPLTIVVIVSLMNLIPSTRSMMGLATYAESPALSFSQSWYVSVSAIRSYPYTGSGLGTFMNDFSQARPESFNKETFWNARMNAPYNDVFMWLATAGLLGVLAYIYFGFDLLKSSFRVFKENQGSRNVAMVAFLSFFLMLLFGSNIVLYVVLFVCYGLLLQVRSSNVNNLGSKFLPLGLAIVTLALFGYVGYKASMVYAAQYHYTKALLSGTLSERYNGILKAVNTEPYEDVYRRDFVGINLLVASALSRSENLTDEQKEQIVTRVKLALLNANALVQRSPMSVANWEVRGNAFKSIIGLVEGADTAALQSYSNASRLEKTNPRLYVEIGGIAYRAKNYQVAVNNFATAVGYKPDYANGHYNLAHALKDAGAFAQAYTQLEVVARLVPNDSPVYEKVSKELEEFKKLRDDQVAAEQAKKLEVPAGAAPTDVERKTRLDEELKNTQEPTDTDVKPTEGVEIPKEEVTTGITPNADGSNVNEEEGETEAPLAKPAE